MKLEIVKKVLFAFVRQVFHSDQVSAHPLEVDGANAFRGHFRRPGF